MKASLLVACLLATGCSSESSRSDTPTPHRSTRVHLDSLDWLSGYWAAEDDGSRSEEVWLPRRGDVMVGLHVDLFPSGRSFFEYLRIEQRGDTLVYAASPRGRPATLFVATAVTDSSVTFDNPDHDFPQRISYHLDAVGRLHAVISGVDEGTERSSEWVWERRELNGSP